MPALHVTSDNPCAAEGGSQTLGDRRRPRPRRGERHGSDPHWAPTAAGRKAYSCIEAGGMRILCGKSDKLQSRYANR